eukprot:3557917-Pyramimonas_sp.AAC.1
MVMMMMMMMMMTRRRRMRRRKRTWVRRCFAAHFGIPPPATRPRRGQDPEDRDQEHHWPGRTR